jgi:hypothetical protein
MDKELRAHYVTYSAPADNNKPRDHVSSGGSDVRPGVFEFQIAQPHTVMKPSILQVMSCAGVTTVHSMAERVGFDGQKADNHRWRDISVL